MQQKYDSTGVLYEKKIINDHVILNPINVVKCNSIDEITFDVENLGEMGSIFEEDFSNEAISVGFVTKDDDLINKYGTLSDGIKELQNDILHYILIQAYDDTKDIIKTFKIDLIYNEVEMIAEYDQNSNELKMVDKRIDIAVDVFKNLDENFFKKYTIPKKINMVELYKSLKETIIGQDEAIRKVISTIDRNYTIEDYRQKTNILLIGPSGSGKTEMFRTIAETINVPIIIEDSEQYSAVGYVGKSVSDLLVNLYNKANKNLEVAERGIIVIDEIDKKITDKKGDVSGDRVLNSLLTMMEGSTYQINIGSEYNPNYIMFDTSKVTFVLIGAFAELSTKQKGMGINNELEKQKKYKEITIEDLKEYGFPSQTLRRLSISRLNELTADDYVNIMNHSKHSSLQEYYKYAKAKNVKLFINDNAIKKIAEIALKKEIGVSGIKDTLNDLLTEAFFEVGINPNQYSSIKVTEETIEKIPPYILTKKRKKK